MNRAPKVANYGVHPGTTSGTIRARSRTDLLTKQRVPPVVRGTNAYTTSSVHPSHTRMDAGRPVPEAHLDVHELSNQQQQQHAYNPAEDAQPYANYVGNLQEQIQVLDAQVGMYKEQKPMGGGGALHTVNRNIGNISGGTRAPVAGSATRVAKATSGRGVRNAAGGVSTPMMEVHETNLLETLNKDAQASLNQADQAHRALDGERRQADLLKQELHQARQFAASERAVAANASKERDQALSDARSFEHQFIETQGTMDQLHRRFDFAMEELNSVKQELDVSRATSRVKQGCSGGCDGGCEAGGPCVGKLGQLEPLHAQIQELQEQIHTKDTRIEDLLECNERAVADQTKSYNALRHEEQKLQMFTAEKESAKCLLREAESEAALLRTENNSLKEEVERLSKRSEDLSHRFQKELDCRSVRDNHMNQSLDTNKVLQQEVKQLNCCYNAEKNVNIEVRAELEAEKRLSDDLRRQLKASQDRYATMQACCTQMEGSYKENMSNFKQSMVQFQANHQNLVSNENKQLGAQMNMLRMIEQDIYEVANGKTCQAAPAPAPAPAPVLSRPTSSASVSHQPQHPDSAHEAIVEAERIRTISATSGRLGGAGGDDVPASQHHQQRTRTLSPPSRPSSSPPHLDTTLHENRRDCVRTPSVPYSMSNNANSGVGTSQQQPVQHFTSTRTPTEMGSVELDTTSAALRQDEVARLDAAQAVALANQAMSTPSVAMALPKCC